MKLSFYKTSGTLLLTWLFMFTIIPVGHADILILSPKNAKATEIAEKIKKRLSTSNVVISEDINALKNPELVITLGSKLLHKYGKDLTAPTLATFVSPSEFSSSNLVSNIPSEAVYSVIDPELLMDFLENSFGKVRVGYIYAEKKDEYVDMLERISNISEIKFTSYKMSEGGIFKTLRNIIASRDIDVMVISNDSRVYNRENIRFVLEALYRKKIPTIGLSKSLIDAGAVAAVFSEENTLIDQTLAAVNTYLTKKNFNGEMYASTTSIVFKKEFVDEFKINLNGNYSIQ